MKRVTTAAIAGLLAAGWSTSSTLPPTGWPQWGGPQRDFRIDAAPPESWQQRPPRQLWKRPLGNGHAAFVVDTEAAYTLYGGARTETVVALEPETGRTLWETRYDVGYQSHRADYDGPHATPLLAGDRLYTVGIDATVHALERRTGKVVWRRKLTAEEGVELPQSGYAASPLRWRDLLLLPGLGGGGAGALALALDDGRTVWSRHDFRSSHASPLLARIGGRDHAIFHGMDWLYGLDPATGEALWRHRVRTGAYDNVSFTPIWDAANDRLLVTHGFDARGARGLTIRPAGGAFEVRELWSNGRLQVRHTNGVLLGGVLYASHGSAGILTAVSSADGTLLWRERLGKANLLAVGDRLILLDEQGVLHLARPTAQGLDRLGSLPVLEYNAWTAPTLAGDRLYLRDRFHAVALELR